MPTTCLRVRQAWGFRSHDSKCQNQPPAQPSISWNPGVSVSLLWVARASVSVLAPNSWHGSQELKSLECQHWQHLDDVLLQNLCFRVQAWLRKVEPKCHFQLFAVRDFPDGVTQLTNREGFSSGLPMFDSSVHPAPHWTPTLNVLSASASCSEDPQYSLDSGSICS